MFLKRSGNNNQILIAACLYLGQMLVGFTISWTGPIIPKLRDLEQSPLPNFLSETQLSIVASLIYLGFIPAPYLIGWLSNWKGRKPCLLIGGIVSITAYAILATSKNLTMLSCGRFFGGLGIGIIGLINAIYIGEIASTSVRRVFLIFLGFFTTCGSILLYAIGSFFSYHITAYVGLSVALAFTLCSFTLPESPIFYVIKDDESALENVLQVLGRINDKEKLLELKAEYKPNKNTLADWNDLFASRANRQGLFVVVTINLLQQCSGFMAIVFYSASVFEQSDSLISWNLGMIIIGCFQLVCSLISPLFLENLGRRTLLLISTFVCSLSMLSLGLYFYFYHMEEPAINNLKWLPLVILIIFFVGYDFGLGIVPSVFMAEMFTNNVRIQGSAVALTCSWLAGFVVTMGFGSLVVNFGGHGAFWFFSCTCACASLFSMFCIPETKGKNLLEIQKYLNEIY